MPWKISRQRTFLVVALTLLGMLPSFGCAGGLAQLLWMWKGNRVPAAYSDFENRKVAVVCVADDGSAGSDVSFSLADKVEKTLVFNDELKKVKGMTVVKQKKIVDWINNEDWNRIDYLEVGKGVQADLVIAIDLSGFSVSDSKSPGLYQGHAHITVRVLNVATGEEEFRTRFPEFVFPEFGKKDITDMSEHQFQELFITDVASEISRLFFKHEFSAGVADDTVRL